MSLAVAKVMNLFGEIFANDTEMTVFTSGDLIYQIGILWSLICLEKVKEEHKVMLKQMLMTYLENLAGKLLNIEETQDLTELSTKVKNLILNVLIFISFSWLLLFHHSAFWFKFSPTLGVIKSRILDPWTSHRFCRWLEN